MENNLPIFLLDINEDLEDDAQVDFISLVDRPAIQRNWNAFKDRQKFEIVSEERRIISGPIMLSNTPIFRSDEHFGDYFVEFTPESIVRIAKKFFKKGFQNNVNLMHSNHVYDEVTLFESFITDEQRGIMPMRSFEDAPWGSWFGSMSVDNDEAWNAVKNGDIKGFSVEGIFTTKPKEVQAKSELISAIKKILSEVK